jgi:CBS domain-containing protein
VNTTASTAGAQLLADAAIAFLRRHPPFDEMEESALRAVAPRLKLAYFPAGTTILAPDHGEPAHLYIVQRGLVHVAPIALFGGTPAMAIALRPGECFSLGALLESRAVSDPYVAAADTFCYLLAGEDFAWLLGESARFREYGTRYLASLLKESRKLLRMQHSGAAAEEPVMARSLRSLVRRAPVMCAGETPLATALETMKTEKIGSMLVHDGAGALIGMLTDRDVLERVALERRDLAQPIRSVMTPHPRTLRADDTAYDAALLIARHGIRHVPVVEDGRTIGIVTERDLFALQGASVGGVQRSIAQADNRGDLVAAARDIRGLAQDLFAHGLSAEQLTRLMSTLNDALTRRVVDLERARHELAGIQWCWLAFGSEGRYEQTIATDQDSGLIFADAPGRTADAVRERLVPFARSVNEALDACGFPLCKGEIMAGNPRWCLSRAEWQLQFELWIATTDPAALLGAAIFFDFRPLHGEAALAESLRAALLAMTAATPRFLRQLAEQAIARQPPLGLFSDFATEDAELAPHSIDLKASGARLFVDAARVLALAAATADTNTAQRLRTAGARLNMSEREIASALDAFFFIQGLRLRAQLAAEAAGAGAPPNRIDPDTLNEVDRRILKESFRQARKLQTRLALDYGL